MKTIYTLLKMAAMCTALVVHAQAPIQAISTTYVSATTTVSSYNGLPATGSSSFSGCSSNNFTYTFNNGSSNGMRLLSFTANAKNYFISNNTPATVKLKRVNNASVTGNRVVVCLEAAPTAAACPGSGTVDVKTPYQDVMEKMLAMNYINQGSDNIFTNTSNSDGNVNNVERVDFLFYNKFSAVTTTDVGFAIFDRGNNYVHDGFRIAAILSIDGNGDPASYGPLKVCTAGNGSNNGSWGHPTAANGNPTLSQYVMRKDAADPYLKVSTALSQQVGGVFFSLADLGIAANQGIYGYSIFPPDGLANPTSAQLLNVDDATVYPTNTTEAVGGLDLMAVTAVFSTSSSTLPVAETLSGMLTGDRAQLNWSSPDRQPGNAMVLQRSVNGEDYANIYQWADTSTAGHYMEHFAGGTQFYRLKITRPGGRFSYSNVVVLKSGAETNYKLYPSCLHQGQSLQVTGLKEGRYTVSFTTVDGRQQHSDLVVQNGQAVLRYAPGLLMKGWYAVSFSDDRGNTYPPARILIQ